MKKRVLSVILAVVIALSVSVPAFAVSFTDLEGHWSKPYMTDLAAKGYLSGYGDGTIKPDNNITACETLALLSRFYDPGDEALVLIATDYEKYVKATVSSSLSWAYDEIMVCLAAGIVTKSELAGMDLKAEIKKEQLSVFLVRAIQLQDDAEALSDAELTFADSHTITASCRGSVAELAVLGIVKGDDENNFSPDLSVTRAVVATMISRSLDYLSSAGKTLVIDGYDGVIRTTGIIDSVSGGSVAVRGFDGLLRVYTMASSASVTVNGVSKAMSTIYAGCYVTLTAKQGEIVSAAIESDSTVKWVQGTLSSVFSSTTQRYIYVADVKSGTTAKYTVSTDAAVTQDSVTFVFSSLKNGSFVTVKMVGDTAVKLDAASSESERAGSVSKITYGTTVLLEVTDAEGAVYRYEMDITDLPVISRGNATVTIDRLSIGEKVTVTVSGGKVKAIALEGSKNTVTGVLTAITTTVSGTQWGLTAADGSTMTLDIDVNAGVYSGTSAILLSSIQVGDTISAVVYGGTATEIYLVSSVSSTTKVSGTVLLVNTQTRFITILTPAQKMEYIDAGSVASIISADTGRSMSLSSIGADSNLVVYGTYSSSNTFTAKSIIIEN